VAKLETLISFINIVTDDKKQVGLYLAGCGRGETTKTDMSIYYTAVWQVQH